MFAAISFALLAYSADAFAPTSGRCTAAPLQMAKGTGFNYDPSNYKDSANEGNYRRLSDQLAAVKAEEDKLNKERQEIIRKEKMEAMFLKQENETFWNTPGDKIVATSEKFFIPPTVLGVIDDLDNQLIGLKPVKEKMRRYAGQMLAHQVREYVLPNFYTRKRFFYKQTYAFEIT